MNSKSQHYWPQLAMDAYLLTLEASYVVWLRWQKMLVGGPRATRESSRMVTEKVIAGMGLVPALAASGALHSAGAMSRS